MRGHLHADFQKQCGSGEIDIYTVKNENQCDRMATYMKNHEDVHAI